MFKKVLLLVIFVFTVSCGYEPMLSKKNINNYAFSISKLNFEGDKTVNLKVKEKLNNYKLNKVTRNFALKIRSTSEKIIIAKDLKGDPMNFKNITTLYVDVLVGNNIKNTLQLQASFNYNNNKNKLDLKKYEKEIKKNLAETITNKLVFKLSNI
tara:strand:+ start:1294 stop:1755 length:462 start_codon:yes stop_codon:yes gene_type:complete